MNTPRQVLVVFLAAGALIAGFVYLAAPQRPPDARRDAMSASAPPPKIARTADEKAATTTAGAKHQLAETEASPSEVRARETLTRITALRIAANQPKSIRKLLVELEQLRQLGPGALPALREFLARGDDADYDSGLGRSGFKDGKVPLDFAVPPSLRLGLLEVARDIGGTAAEELLATELKRTGRGVEAAYIAAALEQLAPGKYSANATAAARDLLAMPLPAAAKNSLDRGDREYLYHILTAAGDRSQVGPAQAQVLLPSGQIDRGALRYLQQALGEDAVAVASQAWEDPRVPANQKEPLGRLALNFVGRNAQAEELYARAINDMNLSPDARSNLIEDLNQDGFPNTKKLTPADLPLIEKRLALIDRLAPQAKDPVNLAAFAEARKDLVQMRAAAAQPSASSKK